MQVLTMRASHAPDRRTLIRVATGLVLFAIAVAHGADLVTFLLMMHAAGPAAELNPIARYAAEQGTYAPLVGAKVALVVLLGSIYAILARRHVALPSLIAWAGVTGGLIGAFSNMRVLVLLA
jgi:hypothetical protein